MILKRHIFSKLLDWKNKTERKPLVIQGARQTGKTWCMKEFGRTNFNKTAYFNFESDVMLRHEFEKSKDPSVLIPILELFCGFKIDPEDCLIIFDEIQECNEALNSLKYFYEKAPEYHIICAGSLLGVALRKGGSFPVGRVEFLTLYPLIFSEFINCADPQLYEYAGTLKSIDPLPDFILEKLRLLYIRYLICGGMPKAVISMLEHNDIEKVDYELQQLLLSYELDFKKHATSSEVPKIMEIWRSLPAQLAKENRKFIYGVVRHGARAREYESALQWLKLAGLVYQVNDVSTPGMPLTAYDIPEAFKIYLFDIGILRALSQLPASIFLSENLAFKEFKGVFAENATLQNLIPQFKIIPRYWTSAGKAEIDFILQKEDSIIPIEVKADKNTASKSLKVYIEKYHPELSVIISSKNLEKKENLIFIPHSLTPWLHNFLSGFTTSD